MEDEKVKRQQFYEQITEDDKAEFINGEVIMHSPAKNIHVAISTRLATLLNHFVSMNDSGFVGIEKLMTEFTRNSYEPDICFYSKEKAIHFSDDQLLHPIPDFIVEILSPSTSKKDRTIKLFKYKQHGVKEYWIVDPTDNTITVFMLENGKYDTNAYSDDDDLIPVSIFGEQLKLDLKYIFE